MIKHIFISLLIVTIIAVGNYFFIHNLGMKIAVKINGENKKICTQKLSNQKLNYEHLILSKEQECEANILAMYMQKCEEEQMSAGGGMNLTFRR